APPLERGPAGADLERDQLGDRAVRGMLAGDPFRISEGQRPRMDRDHEMRVLDRPRDVTGIDLERDGGSRGHARGGGEQGERRKGWLEVSQAHWNSFLCLSRAPAMPACKSSFSPPATRAGGDPGWRRPAQAAPTR